MPRVVHVITTNNFAGSERYVCDAARETAARGWSVTVVGGDSERMQGELEGTVRWLQGATPVQALNSLARLGRQDVCHAHLTIAEVLSLIARPLHRAPVICTRQFAASRGSSRAGRLAAPWISRGLSRQIAVSDFVANHLERAPDAIIKSGVAQATYLWEASSRVVLVMQRLEREKDTISALRAWKASRLAEDGWSLRIVGAGSERSSLQAWAASEHLAAVSFIEWTSHVADEFARAGLLFASAPAEPFGLAVVEAMAAGVPVIACAAGGHLETVGLLPGAVMFPPGDSAAAADCLRFLRSDCQRAALSSAGRELVESTFTIANNVDQVVRQYELACQGQRRAHDAASAGDR